MAVSAIFEENCHILSRNVSILYVRVLLYGGQLGSMLFIKKSLFRFRSPWKLLIITSLPDSIQCTNQTLSQTAELNQTIAQLLTAFNNLINLTGFLFRASLEVNCSNQLCSMWNYKLIVSNWDFIHRPINPNSVRILDIGVW